MCIATKDLVTSKKDTGYKVVIKEGNSYFTGLCQQDRIKLHKDKFRRDPNRNNFSISPEDRGFHVCEELSDAKLIKRISWDEEVELVIVKVQTRKTVCSGIVGWHGETWNGKSLYFDTKTLVVQELKILEEVK